MENKHAINMLEGSIYKNLCIIAIPIALSNILQQLFNASDTAVVGHFASSQAMAAVGSNAPVINMIVTFFTGLSIGANVVLARCIGAKEEDKANEVLHTSFILAIISGLLMLIIGQLIAKPVLLLLHTPANVINMATMYLRIYFCGMPFLMIYDFGSAVLRSIGDTKRPLYFLIIAGIVNVCLNLVFVIGFHRNADGVALATTIANGLSSFLIFYTLLHEQGMLHLDIHKLGIKSEYLRSILWIGLPAGLQGLIFSFSNVVIQASINHFGSACVAGNAAALNFEYICYFIVNGFTQATMTFISQNYAAKNYTRCRKTTRTAWLCAFGFTALLSCTFYLFKGPLLSLFTNDPKVIYYAYIRMTYIALLEPLTSLYEVPGGSLRGIGHSLEPTIFTLIGSCILRIIYITIRYHSFTNFAQVAVIYPISWIITGTAVILLYLKVTKEEYIEM